MKSFTTTNLVTHLKTNHKELYQQFTARKEAMEAELVARNQASTSASLPRQATLTESIDRTRTSFPLVSVSVLVSAD